MQTVNEREENKVVSIFDRNKRSEDKAPEATTEAPKVEDFTWEQIMKRNEENSSRMKQDRNKANKGVIRSYRLKN